MIRIIAILVSVILLTGGSLQAGFEPIIDTAGRAQWHAGPNSPEAVNTSAGISFPCVFNLNTTRVYWDCPVSADLTKSLTIEMELTCPTPEAVQSVGLYLQSGNGWYLWISPIVKPGRQKFFFQVKNAAMEGKTAGWHKIKALRISFQNNLAANTAITLHRIRSGSSGIILVKGTSSAPDNGERKVAEKTTERLSKWLEDAGVGHSVLDDDDLAAGRVRSAAVIVLPYNPHLSDREFGQLEKLSANGSKLIVFYGTTPQLADLLDVKLGKYQAASGPGQWSGFQFNSSAPAGIPQNIIQDSGNIFTVFPISGKSRTIAYWRDISGKTLSDPAWILSEKGAWMTHILLGEDSENKGKMLTALLGHYDSGARQEASQNTTRQSENVAGVIRDQHGKTGEFRAVWDHSGLGLYPGNWNKTCKILADSGITALFPNMLWAGAAHFPSKYVDQIEKSKPLGDQMAQCVPAAHAAGLEIHVWKVCWNLALAPKNFIETMRKQGRLQKNTRGETQNWLCPSDPANIALELNTIAEVVNRHDIDGIHLDYIRYPDADSCYCAGCRSRFEKLSGQPVSKWPAEVLSGPRASNFKNWRSLQITEFVRKVRAETRKGKPGVKLSAAVYPKYPDCIESIGQDWGAWMKEGLVDFVCPMDYFPNVSSFREIINRQMPLQTNGRRIYPGIGVTLDEGDLKSEVFLGQLKTLRERQAGGFILFDLNPSLAANFLPLIGEGTR